MIRYIYKSLRGQEIKELDNYRRGAWIHVESPTVREIEYLAKTFNLDENNLRDALDDDEMPRLEKDGDTSYIFVRFAIKTEDGHLDTRPLLFVFGNELLITISKAALPSLDNFLEGKIEFATTQRAKLVLLILQQISERYDSYIKATAKKITRIRTRLRGHGITNQDFIDFATIEDELNEFLSALLPTNATLRRLLLGRYMPLFEEDQDIVEDLLLNNEQSVEACNSSVKSIANIREAYSSISANNLNRTIKILTIATVMIAIPNLFYGMYGMNVDLPFQHEWWAYGLIVGFTLSLIFVIYYIGRRKNIF